MKYQAFLLKYAEIGIKGKNRYLFEDALIRQLRSAVRRIDGKFKITKGTGRVYAQANENYDFDEAIDAFSHVFGVVGICPLFQTEERDFDKLIKIIVNYVDEAYPKKDFTFKVMTHRPDKTYPLDSQEINREAGAAILDAFPTLSVDVHNPEVLLQIEIRPNLINIYSQVIPGPGGLPLGTNGKAMLLLSGGIDSPVAGYMIAKRGVQIDATYFHAPPYTSERAKQKVIDLAKEISLYCGPITLNVVNFTDTQLCIYENAPHEELTIIMRRYMMKIAEQLSKESGCLALITGESIGQVASQTTHSLAITNAVCTQPVFRPLIGMDKNEIVVLSRKIGTFDTSIQPFEDCCTIFVAKHPVTRPILSAIEKSEAGLKGKIEPLVETAIATVEKIVIDPDSEDF